MSKSNVRGVATAWYTSPRPALQSRTVPFCARFGSSRKPKRFAAVVVIELLKQGGKSLQSKCKVSAKGRRETSMTKLGRSHSRRTCRFLPLSGVGLFKLGQSTRIYRSQGFMSCIRHYRDTKSLQK
jgi:hypothetical protein